MPRIRKALEQFFYLKMCLGRSQSYYGWFSGMLSKFLLIVVTLKVYGFSNIPLLLSLYVAWVVIMTFVGHIDIKLGIAKIETRINNTINQQFMDIHKTVMKNGRKK